MFSGFDKRISNFIYTYCSIYDQSSFRLLFFFLVLPVPQSTSVLCWHNHPHTHRKFSLCKDTLILCLIGGWMYQRALGMRALMKLKRPSEDLNSGSMICGQTHYRLSCGVIKFQTKFSNISYFLWNTVPLNKINIVAFLYLYLKRRGKQLVKSICRIGISAHVELLALKKALF